MSQPQGDEAVPAVEQNPEVKPEKRKRSTRNRPKPPKSSEEENASGGWKQEKLSGSESESIPTSFSADPDEPAPAPPVEDKREPDNPRDRDDGPADDRKADGNEAESSSGGENHRHEKNGGGGGHQHHQQKRFGKKQKYQGGGGQYHGGGPKQFGKKQKFQKQNKQPQRKKRRGQAGEFEPQIDVNSWLQNEALQSLDSLQELAEAVREGEAVEFNELYELPVLELVDRASDFDLEEHHHAPNRRQILTRILAKADESKRPVYAEGVVDAGESGYGILCFERDNYKQRSLSAFIPEALMDRYGVRKGHTVRAQMIRPAEENGCPAVVALETISGRDPEENLRVTPFEDLIPYYPTERILLETHNKVAWDNTSMRVVDLLSPIGFGQRGLIVAPPRTGKTMLLQSIANATTENYPDAHLIVLLVDERPEEVTDFRRQVKGEVIASTFDENAESHVHAAEMVIEKARRLCEVGKDVVILLDSITRLARGYNTMMPSSGKILSGGVEANALQKPKRFFGSARNIEDGGSITILATALIETGSRMDDVIFEEFKGTGNQEIHLDRSLSEKRIFPAFALEKSGTRKEELLYHKDELPKVYSLRRAMKGVPPAEATEMLVNRVKKTDTNIQFLMSVNR